MADPQLLTCEEIQPALLHDFLRRVYPPPKSAFLIEHGAWWHGSNANRLALLVDGEIAGYCAVIPACVQVGGQATPALWWVDLVIAPAFRGRGLQSIFDRRVREMSGLLLGFPNELAASIHRKHGWGVREDLCVMLLPLRPRQVSSINGSHDRSRKWLLRAGALALTPPVAVWRTWLERQTPSQAWKMEKLDAGLLADIARRSPWNGASTTSRDEAHLEWRYGAAPKPEECSYYLAGAPDGPTHYLIARHLRQPGGALRTRILDLAGDFGAERPVHDLLLLAARDASLHGSSQVTLAAGPAPLVRMAGRLGFVFKTPLRFCWWSTSNDLMSALAGDNYWTLGDSDNDPPD